MTKYDKVMTLLLILGMNKENGISSNLQLMQPLNICILMPQFLMWVVVLVNPSQLISLKSALVKEAGFNILIDKIDQPGNQVILASKK
jgi:hypothetical protein